MPTLILTPRYTEDSQALWRAASQLGWDVERLQTWRIPESLRSVGQPVLYVEALFGPTLAEDLGLALVEPPIDWLPNLPEPLRKRKITLTTLDEARKLTRPAFVKPPNDKSFPAKVYATGNDLPDDFDDDTPVLVSDIVHWETEFRCFVLDGKPQAISIYLRDGELQREHNFAATPSELAQATEYIKQVIADPNVSIGKTAVLDVGTIRDRGWAVIEQNAAWGAGIYGCDPVRVLSVLEHVASSIKRA
ncbi:ATP-grasp domain-containing protein [Phycisphaeraceae bacterium D3-23]